jgi:hypothetical protein
MALFPLGILSAAGAGGADLGSYDLLETQILGSATSEIVFSSLATYASTYKHLQIRFSARSSSGAINLRMRINGNTGSNYAWHFLEGNGSSVGSGSGATQTQMSLGVVATTANQFSPGVIDILDSYSTTKNKTVRSLQGAQSGGSSWIGLHSGLYNSTDSITSVTLIAGPSDTWTSASRFSLYGIKG